MPNTQAFKHYLQSELSKRARKNPKFSIRAFARQLEIEPSSLAQIISGRRPLTEKMCLRLAQKLSVRPGRLRSLLAHNSQQSALFASFSSLSEEQFKVIADWYNYAILEITRVVNFKPSIPWISRALNLPIPIVIHSIERLEKLGYLKKDPVSGQWRDTLGSAVNQGNTQTGAALREHQRQILSKAQEALESIPYSERVQSSITLVGSKDRISEAKRRILSFMEELDEFMKSTDAPEEVYALSVSLFPLSQACQSGSPKKEESL